MSDRKVVGDNAGGNRGPRLSSAREQDQTPCPSERWVIGWKKITLELAFPAVFEKSGEESAKFGEDRQGLFAF